MIVKNSEFIKEIRANMRGGEGEVELVNLVPAEYINEKCRLFAKITLKQGSSIGFHNHVREAETYYILSGKATVTDENGTQSELLPGDAMYTGFGAGHSVMNRETEALVFIALILLD